MTDSGMRTLIQARPHLTQYKLTPELWTVTVVGICQLENCTRSVPGCSTIKLALSLTGTLLSEKDMCWPERTGYITVFQCGSNHPKVLGHKEEVLDVAWNPFDDSEIASASHDQTIKIWSIPERGLVTTLKDPVSTLIGHTHKVLNTCTK